MSIKIVSDSGSNILSLKDVSFTSVPLTIMTESAQYVDDHNLNVSLMLEEMKSITGRTGTACPGPGDWLAAFEGADEIIVVTITSKLSGSYNSALAAAKLYQEEHSDAKIFVLDSLSAGPEQELIVLRAADLIRSGNPFDAIVLDLKEYVKHTHLGFSLESLQNFVRNGRVNPALAKLVSMMKIRIVGKASDVGDLEPMNKCPGRKKAISQCFANMKALGFAGGRVRLRHTDNEESALELKQLILSEFPDCDISIDHNRGLCSYYAEVGGVLIGFEC